MAQLMAQFTSPSVTWGPMAPVVIVLGAALIGVLLEAFLPAHVRRTAQIALTLLAVVAAGVAVVLLWGGVRSGGGHDVMSGSLVVDGTALVAWGVILLVALLSVLVMADRTGNDEDAFTPAAWATPGSPDETLARERGLVQTEVYPLMLFAIGGMLVFAATNDLLTLFVGLEVLSLPLYLLSGMARRRRLQSQEASLKYFLLGAFASAVLIFGVALIYGFAGSLSYADIANATLTLTGDDTLLLVGAVMVLVGLFFKVGAVPFHLWTPDVYQGAPTPVTGFMAAGTKVAAFAAMLRVVYVMLPSMQWELQVVLWVVAIATMVVGTGAALVQTDIKRLLAYSSVAHAGFILTAVAAFHASAPGAVMFYLLTYGAATVGAFAIIALVRERSASGGISGEATSLAAWSGLGRTHPVIAGTMLLFMLSFAGIPLTAGFVGKFAVFSAALAGGAWPLALIGVLASAAAAFAYVKVLVVMFFPTSRNAEPAVRSSAVDAESDAGTAHAGVSPVSGGAVSDSAASGGAGVVGAVLDGAASGGAVAVVTAPAPVLTGTATVVASRGWANAAIAICAVLTLLLGIVPGPVLDAIDKVATFLR